MRTVLFPFGVSNFEQLITQDFIYVDKTQFIEKLEKEKFVSFLRPRRFGKSLWLSVLEYYYDINQKHKFDKLFGKYYIGQNPTPLRNAFRILKFDFSGIDASTRESAKQGFNFSVRNSLQTFCNYYQVLKNSFHQILNSNLDAEEMLSAFFYDYKTSGNIPIYLLFDEYDHFTNDILYRSKNEFIDSVSKQGYIRKFYEVIKTATQQGVVDRLFMTGVSSVTLDALTSGFNILTHLTHSEHFEAMMGFTENEVRELLRLILQKPDEEENIINLMREWYNGYRFYEYSNQRLYNSDMVLYFLRNFQDYQKPPSKMLDPNITPDYGKLKQMFHVINAQQNHEILREVLEKGHVTAPLIEQFNFERGFGSSDFINFLAYMGNLTIDKAILGDIIQFKIPNRVIEELYWQYYAEVLQNQAELNYEETNKILPATLEMALQGNYQDFFKLIQNLLRELSNRDYRYFNEKHIKMAILSYLSVTGIFYVISEPEMKSGGYPDLILFNKPNNPPHHQYVIELKYLKKEQAHELEKVQQEAKAQLLGYYESDKALQARPNMHLLTVVAVKEQLYVEEVHPRFLS